MKHWLKEALGGKTFGYFWLSLVFCEFLKFSQKLIDSQLLWKVLACSRAPPGGPVKI